MSVGKGMISDADWAEVKEIINDPWTYGAHVSATVDLLATEVERLRKVIQDDDEVIDDLRCAGAKLEAEVERAIADATAQGSKALHLEAEIQGLRKELKQAKLDYDLLSDDYRELTIDVARLRVDLAVAKAGGEAPGFWDANKPPSAP